MEFRYHLNGHWYKGNTHIHSTVSDGGKTFAELAQMYAEKGYHFLFRTDHWQASDVQADVTPYPLLWLDGVELDGKDYSGAEYHIACLGGVKGVTRSVSLVSAVEMVRAQGGLLVMAHPHWMGNSLEDALRLGFHGVEVYNHVCQWLNGKGDGTVYWNAMLQRFPNTLAFASDDAHIRAEHPGWDGGWINVAAEEYSCEAIFNAIRAGNFYSSCGPEIYTLDYRDNRVSIQTSPVKFIRMVGPGYYGERVGSFDGQVVSEAAFDVNPQWAYTYIELEDECGRRAWTNPLFVR